MWFQDLDRSESSRPVLHGVLVVPGMFPMFAWPEDIPCLDAFHCADVRLSQLLSQIINALENSLAKKSKRSQKKIVY